ncbi:hypothetical protein ACK8HX_08995 [Oryzobacter sp. R7]|uniref:hypothetical protein n=1 Tax=Oryzobacter faecalis TaxID=3388656 RepID=UPI00398D0136
MGLITGLATITTVLTVGLVVLGAAVAALVLGVAVPTLRAERAGSRAAEVPRGSWTPAPHPA